MGKSFYTGTDAELNTGAQHFSSVISDAPEDYGISTPAAVSYANLTSIYAAAYLAAIIPETRTRGRVTAKNTARENLRKASADLASVIDGTPAVSDQQKVDLGLNVRKQPARNGRPTVRPGMDMVSVNGRTVAVHIHDSASSTKRGKPAGTVAAWVYTFVGADYPSDPTLWDFQGSARKGKFEITFPSELPGGTQVWVCAAWVNTTDEAGPTSVPISTNLQGGGSSSSTMTMNIAA